MVNTASAQAFVLAGWSAEGIVRGRGENIGVGDVDEDMQVRVWQCC